jgi:type VI secretion system protein ImpI
MRLELRPETKTDTRQSLWVLEHGRRTLGRSRECDWLIEDDTRRVSKLHCTIFRDGKRFSLSDQSANGTLVDGKQLMEGDAAPLKNGSLIDVRGHRFNVAIIGEVEQDFNDPAASLQLSDESLTISSILSDIAPNGSTARGIMGERMAEEPWKQTPASSTTKNAKTLTRNVDIGWRGPPQVNGSTPVLPDNWFDDEDYGSQLEHHNATRTVVSVSPPKRKEVAAVETLSTEEPPTSRSEFDEVFAEPSRSKPVAMEQSATHDPRILKTIGKALVRLEAASADCFSTLGMATDSVSRTTALDAPDIITRLEGLVKQQQVLGEVLERVMREATQKLDPRLLEARVDAEQSRLQFLRGRDYWNTYRQQFEEAGGTLTIKDFIRRAATGEPAFSSAAPNGPENFGEPDNFKGVDTKDEA